MKPKSLRSLKAIPTRPITSDPKDPEIKVTKIGKKWHCRLYWKGKAFDEMSCENSLDIGWCCREMLRWFDKLGGSSLYAHKARERQNKSKPPVGRIQYIGNRIGLAGEILSQ